MEEINTTTLALSEDHINLICELKENGKLPNLKNLILMDCD